MKQQNQVPKFAHLNYQVLHDLEISINEYFLMDMIFHLSGNGRYWCNKKLENIAFDMRMSKRGATGVRDRLIEKKLLLKGIGNKLRTSEKVHKVYFLDESELQKSALSAKKMQKVHPKSAESVAKTPVENNRRLTLEKKDVISEGSEPQTHGSGYAKYVEAKRRLRARVSI
jgi:hypothetical protein